MELNELHDYHTSRFGEVRYKVWAPGRINLIGEHTDYNNGYVLPAAIGSGITFLFSTGRDTDRFELYSANLDAYESFHRNDKTLPPDNWAKYLQAMVRLLKEEEHIVVPGFQLSLKSDIPPGGGLSSSAALNVGFILAINEHGNHQWSLKKMAELAQFTEHRIGARVGIMDPYAILAGQKDHFIQIDCRTDEYIPVSAHMADQQLLLIDTGISHDLADSEYNDRRKVCEKVLNTVQEFRNVQYVSDLTPNDLKLINNEFPEVSTIEVQYVLEENQRVLDVVKALYKNRSDLVGSLMYQSHAGLRDKYRVSCKELDFLVELAQTYGIEGARMMGGGFGGSTINLLPRIKVDDFKSYVMEHYSNEFGRPPDFLSVSPADGASLRCF